MKKLGKKAVDYSNYYSSNKLSQSSNIKKSKTKLQGTEKLNFSHYKNHVVKRIPDVKSNQRDRKKRRSWSGDKGKNIVRMVSENTIKSHLKHISPTVDRWVLDELKASSTIPDGSNEVANKIYQSHNKAGNSKSITARDLLFKKLEKLNSKHNKSTKG